MRGREVPREVARHADELAAVAAALPAPSQEFPPAARTRAREALEECSAILRDAADRLSQKRKVEA